MLWSRHGLGLIPNPKAIEKTPLQSPKETIARIGLTCTDLGQSWNQQRRSEPPSSLQNGRNDAL